MLLLLPVKLSVRVIGVPTANVVEVGVVVIDTLASVILAVVAVSVFLQELKNKLVSTTMPMPNSIKLRFFFIRLKVLVGIDDLKLRCEDIDFLNKNNNDIG